MNNELDISDLQGLTKDERFALYSSGKKRQKQIESAIQSQLPDLNQTQRSLQHYEQQKQIRKTDAYDSKISELKKQLTHQAKVEQFQQSADFATTRDIYNREIAHLKGRGASDEMIRQAEIAFGVFQRTCGEIRPTSVFETINSANRELNNRDRMRAAELNQQSADLDRQSANLKVESMQIEGQVTEQIEQNDGTNDESN